MTGNEVRAIRDAFELDAFAFARLLGVHVSTVYRWEASTWHVTMDPLPSEILTAAQAHLATQSQGQRDVLALDIKHALTRGPLHGLAALLRVLVGT